MPSKPIKSNNQLAAAAREHHEQIAAWEAKVAIKCGPPSIDDLIVTDPGWTGSIEQAAWLNNCTVDEWRAIYKKRHGK